MSRVGVASSSRISAEAGARIADAGGNAIDAAIAASLVSMTTEPGVCSLGGGGYVTVWPTSGDPVTIDGNVEMPGRGVPDKGLGRGAFEAPMGYGGGITTLVGHGTVGTPGALAALGLASERYGKLPWKELVQPAWEHARSGFPLPQASYDYLIHSHEVVFGWNEQSSRALHDANGALLQRGATIRVEYLADSLAAIAENGPTEFYRGAIARLIAEDSVAHEGPLTLRDLNEYEPVARVPLSARLGEWRFATNPAPAVGGITLMAMLLLMRIRHFERWDTAAVRHLIRVQEAVLAHRRDHLDLSDDVASAAIELLQSCREGKLRRLLEAPSTVHASAVDLDRSACSITMSAGYGSGVMPPGTGIWMNNCLGELELNRRGLIAGPPGTRLPSNMAPTAGRRRDGAVLAIGSPGASRITTAVLQTLVNYAELDMTLRDAINHPRAHLEFADGDVRIAYEPALPVDEIDVVSRRFDGLSMYFGGVAAALAEPDHGITVAADPRRSGGEALGG